MEAASTSTDTARPAPVAPVALVALGIALAADLWASEVSFGDLDALAVRTVLMTAAVNDEHSVEGAYALVMSHMAHLVQSGDFSEDSARKFGQLAARLIAYLSRVRQVADIRVADREMLLAWMHAPLLGDELKYPKERTLGNRRWAADLFFRSLRALGLFEGDPLLDVPLPARPARKWRGLTDVEVEICRYYARVSKRDLRGPVRWALAEATGTSGEVPFIVGHDVDLERGAVWLDAPSRYAARWGYFTEWGLEQVERLIQNEDLDPSASLVYTGRGRLSARQSTTCIALTAVLRRAQLLPDPLVKVSFSIRSWAARWIYLQHHELDEVEHRLGVSGLDAARELVDLPWGRCDIPPAHRTQQ